MYEDKTLQCGVFCITHVAYLTLRIIARHRRGDVIQDAHKPLEVDHPESRAPSRDPAE
jgi:hypothetical protein